MTDVSISTDRSAKDENVDVFEFLHSAGDRYREHLSLLRKRQEEEIKKGCKPFVSPFAEQYHAQRQSIRSEAIEERLHKLHKARLEKEKAAAARYVAEAEKEEQQELQSAPKITSQAQRLTGRSNQAEVSAQWLQEQQKRREKLAEENLKREMREVRAVPSISTFATKENVVSRRNGLSIEEHLLVLADQRRTRLYEATEKEQAAPCGTHQPHITNRAQGSQRGEIVARLYTPNYKPKSYDEEFERECTFTPKINRLNRQNTEPVHERLLGAAKPNYHSHCHEDHIQSTPKISETSRILVEKRRRMQVAANPSDDARNVDPPPESGIASQPTVNRKSQVLWEKRKEAVKREKGATDDGGCALGSWDVRRILWEKSAQKKQAQLDKMRKDREVAELTPCTFRPFTGHPRRVDPLQNDPAAFMKREEKWVRKRDAKMMQMKNDAELFEIAGCTFQPIVHEEIPLPNPHNPTAPGFEAHLFRMQTSRKQRENVDTPRRERSVVQTTTPVPFKLGKARQHDISSLQPPMNRQEWAQIYENLHESEQEYPRLDAAPPYRFTPEYFPSAEASPVEFLLNNHEAIIKSVATPRSVRP